MFLLLQYVLEDTISPYKKVKFFLPKGYPRYDIKLLLVVKVEVTPFVATDPKSTTGLVVPVMVQPIVQIDLFDCYLY